MNLRYCKFNSIDDSEVHLQEYFGKEKVLFIDRLHDKEITKITSNALKDLEKTRVIILGRGVKELEKNSISSKYPLVVYTPLEENEVKIDLDSHENVTFRFGMKYFTKKRNVFYATFRSGYATIFDHSLMDYFELNEGENERQIELLSEVFGCRVTIIESYAIENAYNIENIILPRFLKSIGRHAFSICSSLRRVWLPKNVVSLGGNAFEYCKRLQYVVINNKIEHIGDKTFLGSPCTSVLFLGERKDNNKEIRFITDNPCYYGFLTFEYHEGVEYALLKNKEAIIFNRYKVTREVLEIPSSISYDNEDYDVTEVGLCSFKGNHRVKKIVLPHTIRVIQRNAFMDSYLEEINVPLSVTKLLHSTFRNCYYLTRVELHDEIETIDSLCFNHCYSLEKIYLSSKLNYIGRDAFEFSGLRQLDLPNNISSLEPSLTNTNVHSLVIPKNINTLTNYSVGHIESLRLLVIQNENMVLDKYVIHYFSDLTVAYPGEQSSKFESEIISGLDVTVNFLPELVYIYVYEGVIYGVFSKKRTAEVLGYKYFDLKKKIRLLSQIEGVPVTRINQNAFENSLLEEIEIVDSIIDIGDNVFKGCKSLTKIYLRGKSINKDHWIAGNTDVVILDK